MHVIMYEFDFSDVEFCAGGREKEIVGREA